MEGQRGSSQKSNPKVLPIICVAFIAMIVLMMLIIQPDIERSEGANVFDLFVFIGFAGLLAGLVYSQFRLRPDNDGSKLEDMNPAKFQVDTLLSLALIEMCALMGVFMVQSQLMSMVMPVAAIVAISLFVLPNVLQYVKAIGEES